MTTVPAAAVHADEDWGGTVPCPADVDHASLRRATARPCGVPAAAWALLHETSVAVARVKIMPTAHPRWQMLGRHTIYVCTLSHEVMCEKNTVLPSQHLTSLPPTSVLRTHILLHALSPIWTQGPSAWASKFIQSTLGMSSQTKSKATFFLFEL
jgi:hypothetical protein